MARRVRLDQGPEDHPVGRHRSLRHHGHLLDSWRLPFGHDGRHADAVRETLTKHAWLPLHTMPWRPIRRGSQLRRSLRDSGMLRIRVQAVPAVLAHSVGATAISVPSSS